MPSEMNEEYHLVRQWSLKKAADEYVLYSLKVTYRSALARGDEEWARKNAERLGIEIEESDDVVTGEDNMQTPRGGV